jgi:hypothetical protein
MIVCMGELNGEDWLKELRGLLFVWEKSFWSPFYTFRTGGKVTQTTLEIYQAACIVSIKINNCLPCLSRVSS